VTISTKREEEDDDDKVEAWERRGRVVDRPIRRRRRTGETPTWEAERRH